MLIPKYLSVGQLLWGVIFNAVEGRIPSSIGSGLLAVTSYYSFKYRRSDPLIDDSIDDSRLLKHAMESLSTDEAMTPERCLVVFDATLDSEKASVTRMAAQLVKARTYTPLGFMRLAIYNFHRKRRFQKRQAALGEQTES